MVRHSSVTYLFCLFFHSYKSVSFDFSDIVNFGIKHKVDFIAASFVRKNSDVTKLRELLADNGGPQIKIICKIENQEGLQNYNSILQETDGIMVARGDLGMEIPPSKVFLAQKMMIREANIAGKYVVTATQMLESMITNPRPTRAECSDVANAVMDGTDCVMLSGETANGPYFEQAVRVMARTCCEAENARNYNALFAAVRRSVIAKYAALTGTESLASSAVKTAIDVHASIMVVLSETGNTARLLAKYCPGCTVICLTTNDVVARQCAGVLKGVHCYVVDSLGNDVELVQQTGSEAIAAGVAKEGDLMVVVSGTLTGHGNNNQVRVEVVRKVNQASTVSGGKMKRLLSFVVADA
jgi:pyruvate kinase